MRPKHTTGRWNWTSELSEDGKLTGKQIIYDDKETLGYAYRDIAHLPACKSKAETRANAILIAAAPELVEALEHVVAYMEQYRPAYCGIDDDRDCSPYNDAVEALAKAKGETK